MWYCEEEDKELYLAQHCRMLLEARMLDIHRTAYSDSAGSVVTRETTVSRMTEWFRLQKERHITMSVGKIPKMVMKQRRQESMSYEQTDRKCIGQEDKQIDKKRQTHRQIDRLTNLQSGGNFGDIPPISVELQIPKKGLRSGFFQSINNTNSVEDT